VLNVVDVYAGNNTGKRGAAKGIQGSEFISATANQLRDGVIFV
jgi:hypothetical protein